MRVAAVGVGLMLAGVCAPAGAQSLYGPGGLFLHPTASVAAPGDINPSFLFLPQRNSQSRATRIWMSTSVSVGLPGRIEAGVTALKVTGWDRNPSFGGFVKYQFRPETLTSPALAIGATQLSGGDVNNRQLFLAARKKVGLLYGRSITANLGAQYVDEEDGISRHEFRPYAGLELGLSERLSFIAEARPLQNREFGMPLALTFSYRASDRMKFALTYANNGLSDEPRIGFGAGYSLGARR